MYRAKKSFSGKITMREGEVREISDQALVKDLLRCNYVEEIKEEKKPKKGAKKDEYDS